LASSLHDAYPEFTYLIPEFPHHTCPEFTVRIWPLVEQELLTLPEHLSSHPVCNGVRVTRSLVLCVYFVDRCLSFCTFSFGHCVVCSSSICRFWLPLWYLRTLLRISVSYLSRIHWPHPLIYIIPVNNSLSPPPKATYHTYPEFTGHIPKSLFIVIPSSKEIDTTILSSLKHLNHRTKSGFCFIKSIFLLTYMTSEVQDISEAYTHLILQITP
jgi:hypothetical protein